MNVRFLTPASREFDETVGYFHKIGPDLSERYQVEAKRVLGLILANPQRYRVRNDQLRYAKLRRFSYHYIYWFSGSEIVIVAVAHTSREPGYWRDRLPDFK